MMFEGREWIGCDGADRVVLAALREQLGPPLSQAYIDLLAHTNGGEGALARQPFHFVLDSAEVALEEHVTGRHSTLFPGFFMFGGSGGGEFIAFDMRGGAPWPVVAIDMTNADLEESVMTVADTFEAFLELIGREAVEG